MPKVIGSIVAIIAAVLLIVWQVKANGPKKYEVSDEVTKAVQVEDNATREVFDAAIALAAKSGWDATSKYWANGRLNAGVKKNLKTVFGSSFSASDLKDVGVSRDSESGRQSAIFEFKGKSYVFYFVKSKQGKYQIVEFNAW